MSDIDKQAFDGAVLTNRAVFAERLSQIKQHGWSIEHDNGHTDEDFARLIEMRTGNIQTGNFEREHRHLFLEIAALASAAAERIARAQPTKED